MIKLSPRRGLSKPICRLKVRIIKAPLVDSGILREVLAQRQLAVVL